MNYNQTTLELLCEIDAETKLALHTWPSFTGLIISMRTAQNSAAVSISCTDALSLAATLIAKAQTSVDPADMREYVAALMTDTNARSLPEFVRPPKKTTPTDRRSFSALPPLSRTVYLHMKRAGSISARDAMADHGITSASLARRICDIEAEGFEIKRDRRVHPLTQRPYTRYTLADE